MHRTRNSTGASRIERMSYTHTEHTKFYVLPVWSPWCQSQSCRFLNSARVLTITISAICYPVSNRFIQFQQNVAIAKWETRCSLPAVHSQLYQPLRMNEHFNISRYCAVCPFLQTTSMPTPTPDKLYFLASRSPFGPKHGEYCVPPLSRKWVCTWMTDQHAIPHSDYVTAYCSAVCTVHGMYWMRSEFRVANLSSHDGHYEDYCYVTWLHVFW